MGFDERVEIRLGVDKLERICNRRIDSSFFFVLLKDLQKGDNVLHVSLHSAFHFH